jgi:hypothetical protein
MLSWLVAFNVMEIIKFLDYCLISPNQLWSYYEKYKTFLEWLSCTPLQYPYFMGEATEEWVEIS